jgi:hypothetical protein
MLSVLRQFMSVVSSFSRQRRSSERRRNVRFRPRLEMLEERAVPAIVYDNAAQFSPTYNPHGAWSYGYLAPSSTAETPDASTFTLYTHHGQVNSPSLDYWNGGAGGISYNPNGVVVNYRLPGGTITFQPYQAAFHPGPDGEYSDYRFTAPGAGTYSLSSVFTGIDRHGSTAKDIHVLDNGAELYDDLLPGSYGSVKTYQTTVTLAKGDHVDFVLGYGLGPWDYDSTALDARLTVVAAPATHFAVFGPNSSQAGKPFSVTVTALDDWNRIVTSYRGTVHFTSSDARAVLPADYTFTAADLGRHSFPYGVKLVTAGLKNVIVTDIQTSTLTGKRAVNVTPAAATHLIVSAPPSVTAGTAFSITITAVDAYGNIATGFSGTVRFTSTDPSAMLPAPFTFGTINKGVHTFTNVILRAKGTQTITVIDALNKSIAGSVNIDVI